MTDSPTVTIPGCTHSCHYILHVKERNVTECLPPGPLASPLLSVYTMYCFGQIMV
jgi:hypothetical protein